MTGDRVRAHTSEEIQAGIDREASRRVEHLAGASEQQLTARLDELSREWDVERALEVNASTLILVSATIAAVKTRSGWFLLPAVVAAFLLQHGLRGWCPPLPLLRRLGFRSLREIDAERTADRLLRGDLRSPSDVPQLEGSAAWATLSTQRAGAARQQRCAAVIAPGVADFYGTLVQSAKTEAGPQMSAARSARRTQRSRNVPLPESGSARRQFVAAMLRHSYWLWWLRPEARRLAEMYARSKPSPILSRPPRWCAQCTHCHDLPEF